MKNYRLKRELITKELKEKLPALCNTQRPLEWWTSNNIANLCDLELANILEASHLRIGNILDRENTGHEFIVKSEVLHNWGKFKRHLFPMPLTGEWLLRLGGIISSAESREINLNGFKITPSCEGGWRFFNVNIQYVHQLQNLYSSITGEELELKQNN